MRAMQLTIVLALLAALSACDREPNPPAAEGGHEVSRTDEAHEQGEEESEAMPRETTIAAKTAQAAGIRVTGAEPGVIADEHEVQGQLTPVQGRVAQVMARFPGPILALRANVGDRVRAGQPLATIESNLSLSTYSVASPLSGIVVARNASVGSVAGDGVALYEIADLSELWVDLHIFGADAQQVRAGVPVLVTRISDGVTTEINIDRVLPGTAAATQSTIARATLRNPDGLWRPGSAVKARVTVNRQPVNLVVPSTALQSSEGQDVVYVRRGETYHTRPVKVGRRDAERIEVLSGLKLGEQVVAEQSFLVKADIEKSTVEED